MSLDASFPVPCHASLFQVMVAAASIGWKSEILANSDASGLVQYGLWLRHRAWHGSLCEVEWHTGFFPFRPYQEADAENELGLALRSVLPELMTLWRDFPDQVPCFVDGTPVVNTSETALLPDYRSGARPVRYPTRMNPILALPGWPGRESMSDYLGSEAIGPGGLDAALITMGGRSAKHQARAHAGFTLATDSYVGIGPAGATWNLTVSQYPRRHFESLREGKEAGGAALSDMLDAGMRSII